MTRQTFERPGERPAIVTSGGNATGRGNWLRLAHKGALAFRVCFGLTSVDE